MPLSSLWLKFKLGSSLTLILIVINILLFLVSTFLTGVYGSVNSLKILGAEYLPYILGGEFWRLVIPAFLHANIFHLGFNMWALYHLGNAIETFYGSRKLLATYILAGFGGGLVSSIASLVGVYLTQDTTSYPISVGASGAIFGFVGLLLGNKFKKNTYSVSIENYTNTSQLWLFIVYNIIIGFGVNLLGVSIAINNFAHIGGFITGFVLGLIFDLVNTTYQTRLNKIFEKVLFYSAVLLLLSGVIGQLYYLTLIIY